MNNDLTRSGNPRHPRQRSPFTKECWLCGRRGRKYYADHHVVTAGEDLDLTVTLHRGCHWLVNLLSRFGLIDDPEKLEDLIMLARAQAGLPNARIVVRFEEVK